MATITKTNFLQNLSIIFYICRDSTNVLKKMYSNIFIKEEKIIYFWFDRLNWFT